MCNSLKVDEKGRLKIPMTLLTTLKGLAPSSTSPAKMVTPSASTPCGFGTKSRDNWNACACTT